MVKYVCDSCGQEGSRKSDFWELGFECLDEGDGWEVLLDEEKRLLCRGCAGALLKMIDGDSAGKGEE